MISAEIIARILLHPGLPLCMGDPVLAWDNDGEANSDFLVGRFEGYDHSFGNGTKPFLVRLERNIVHYTHIKAIPTKYLGFLKLSITNPATTNDSRPDCLREEVLGDKND